MPVSDYLMPKITIKKAKKLSKKKWRKIEKKLLDVLDEIYKECGFCTRNRQLGYGCHECIASEVCRRYVTYGAFLRDAIPDRITKAIKDIDKLIDKLEEL